MKEKIKTVAIILGVSITIVTIGILALYSTNKYDNTKTVTTTPTIDRTVIGTVQTIDSYADYSILRFDNNVNIEVANTSLNNWRVGNMFGQVATYQLKGVGMSIDGCYGRYDLVNFQIGKVIIGGK